MVVAEQVPEAPIIVYVVVEFGLAITLEPFEEFKLVFGIQVYVLAPDTFNVAEPPRHNVELFTDNDTLESTLIAAVAVFTQPNKLVPETE